MDIKEITREYYHVFGQLVIHYTFYLGQMWCKDGYTTIAIDCALEEIKSKDPNIREKIETGLYYEYSEFSDKNQIS